MYQYISIYFLGYCPFPFALCPNWFQLSNFPALPLLSMSTHLVISFLKLCTPLSLCKDSHAHWTVASHLVLDSAVSLIFSLIPVYIYVAKVQAYLLKYKTLMDVANISQPISTHIIHLSGQVITNDTKSGIVRIRAKRTNRGLKKSKRQMFNEGRSRV